MKKVALHNLGCKVNAYETEAMQEMLEKEGYEIVPFKEGADIYIINTCTVTNMADRKSRQMLHRAKKLNPDAIVVATGCYVQAQEENGKRDECIDIIIGNNKKKDLIEILENHIEKSVIDINHTKEYEEMHLSKTAEHTRAYIKVQDGCNQFCTYCIIPKVRGNFRSIPMEELLKEARELAEGGVRELILVAQETTLYGMDLYGKKTLPILLKELCKIEDLKWIRLLYCYPEEITEELIQVIKEEPKICHYLDIPISMAGSSLIPY